MRNQLMQVGFEPEEIQDIKAKAAATKLSAAQVVRLAYRIAKGSGKLDHALSFIQDANGNGNADAPAPLAQSEAKES